VSGIEVSAPLSAQYAALRTTAGVHLARRDVVAVEGPDATSYLQGQCSQEVAGLAIGDSAEALLLSPQGKVEVYVRITRRGDDAFVIDTDAGYGPAIIARLERFRLRTKVTMAPLDWVCVNVRGPDAREAVVGQPTLEVAMAWPGLSGVDLLGPAPAPGPRLWVAAAAIDCGEEAWEAARIEAGVPVNGREVVEGTIAAEVGLVERTVSFTKGCFTGQELVARLDARGSKVARSLRAVTMAAGPEGDAPPVGADVLTADGSHPVGHLSSVAWSPGRGSVVALATLHRRVSPPEPVLVRWQPSDDQPAVTVTGHSHLLPLVG
jgi:folate-binding protein YgfZ